MLDIRIRDSFISRASYQEVKMLYLIVWSVMKIESLLNFFAKPLVFGSHVEIGVRKAEEGWMEHLSGFALDA